MTIPDNTPAYNEDEPSDDAVVEDGTDPQTSDVSSDLDFDAIRSDYQADYPADDGSGATTDETGTA